MNKNLLRCYFIMGSQNGLLEPLKTIEEALKGGVTLFQLREKGKQPLTGDTYIQFARDCQKLCQKYDVPFIVNDDIELAKLLDADGVHIGQDDMTLAKVRQLLPNKIIGLSVHTMDELDMAIQYCADYVGIGPIYSTSSKDDAKLPAGTDFLSQAASHPKALPSVAIGGITIQHIPELRRCGANGVAVISEIADASSPRQKAEKIIRCFS